MILVVRKCDDCPFLTRCGEERHCNIGVPARRFIPEDVARPDWCRLKKEQVIVREPSA